MIREKTVLGEKGQFYHRVVKIWPALTDYRERRLNRQVEFDISNYELNFTKLVELSELLGTAKIHIDTELIHGYYDDVECVLEVRVEEVEFARREN